MLPRARPREGVGHVVHGGGPLAEVEAVHAVDPRGRGAGAVVVVAQGLAAPEKEGSEKIDKSLNKVAFIVGGGKFYRGALKGGPQVV